MAPGKGPVVGNPEPRPDHLGPYLTLPHRLTLAPFALPVIATAFVTIRLYLTWLSAHRLIGDAKEFILASCLAAQRAASVAVSAVRWIATQLNEGMVEVATNTVEAARKGALLCLTTLDNIIAFFVDKFKTIYVGMFKVFVLGSLNAIVTVTTSINSALTSLANGVGSAVSAAQNGINGAISAASAVLSINIPQLNVPTSSLQNVNIPDPISSQITAIQSSLPTLDDLQKSLSGLVSQPFANVRTEVNNTLINVENDVLKADLLPLPDPRSVHFCDDIDLSWVDKFGGYMLDPLKWVTIGFAILFGLLLLCSILWEIYAWGKLQAAVKGIQSEWSALPSTNDEKRVTDGTVQPTDDDLDAPLVELTPRNVMLLRYQLEHGYMTYALSRVRRSVRLPRTGVSNISWFFAYITYPPALLCLLIGILGLIAVSIQDALFRRAFNALDNVDDEIAHAIGSAGNWTQKITGEIEDAISTDSQKYASAVNSWMENVSGDINNKVFGSAVDAAGNVNQTVVRLYGDIESGVRNAFKGTMFESVGNTLIQKVLGDQVYRIGDAVTWMKNNLHIRLPHVDASRIQLAASDVADIARTVEGAATAGGDAAIGGAKSILQKVVDAYEAAVRKERIVFALFICIWGVVVLFALIGLVIRIIKYRKTSVEEDEKAGQ
ncbi:related to plasma membrane fusion protein PRM1-Laccaria bicolor [Serendipita indica DSM 11827]|uniref:Plasma membrane fusion protein PRM1 n=1 Tax=Serendipita indica (strain DSM 11827) TaxID=1109443 RepID=G4TIH4_SERID|nr:related to plasma membrane fusion protein PRM1-Laccaria bicolor [Serendipita indica DSM 11827]